MTGAGWDSASGRLGPGAAWYAENLRWKVFPTYGIVGGKCGCGRSHDKPKDQGKHPHGELVHDGFKSATDDAEKVREWWEADPEANVAVWCEGSGIMVLDVDPRNGGLESWGRLEELVEGALPETVEALTGVYSNGGGRVSRGRHLFYKVGGGERLRGGVEGLRGLDVKHRGYVLVNPSRHASGVVYEWREGRAPWECDVAWAPEELLELIRKGKPRGSGGEGKYGEVEWNGERLDVDDIVSAGIPEGERANTLYKIACAFSNQYPVSKEHGKVSVRNIMRGIAEGACHPPMEWGTGGDDDFAPQCESAINFVLENPPGSGAIKMLSPDLMRWVNSQEGGNGKVVEAAEVERGRRSGAPVLPSRSLSAMPVNPDETLPPDSDEWGDDENENEEGNVVRRSLTDRGNARRLRDYYRGTIRYSPGMGWFIWDGMFWRPDDEGLGVLEKSQVISRLISRELVGMTPGDDDWKRVSGWAIQSKGTARLKSAIEQWKADSQFTKTPASTWDCHPHLLGVKNGVINLKTGELLEPRLEMNITKCTDVAYTPGMTNIRWDEFLSFVTGGDVELQRWLQKAAGYTLTGYRDHDVFMMLYGQPGSGKSTFLEAMGHALGNDYMVAMNSNVLVDDGMKSSSDEYHWAQLRGKRMAVFSEWPYGRRTKEDAIKRLTGDMTIQARHPGERPFNFQSQAKLWLGTNEKPQITEDAMFRRIRAIPFPHVPSAPDPGLKPYLLDPEGGLPAVVSWCVEGAVRLLNSPERDSLGWCKVVADASAEYRRAEDRMGLFLEEETVVREGASVPVKMLHNVYRMWSEDRGEKGMTPVPFIKQLERRGLVVKGRGRAAILEDRQLVPRVVEEPPSWGDLARYAR